MISMTIKGECPYCHSEYERTCGVESDVEGDYVDSCPHCEKRFLIHWIMLIDATTMKISEATPPVRCSVDLNYWSDDDDFDEEGEIEA